MEVVDNYFTKTEDNNTLCTEGHFNIFIVRKLLMKVLMLYVHITMLKKMMQYLSSISLWDTQSDVMKVKIDHCFDFFETFYQQYFIMPIESSN